MTAPAIVVGIGQLAAGDDGVGLAVARELAGRGVAVRESADASILLALLDAGHRVVVVDAVAGGGPPGSVIRLAPEELGRGPTPLSSHGLGVAEAIVLARVLYGPRAVAGLEIVGIAIASSGSAGPRSNAQVGLSPAVAAAVGPAAALVAELARSGGSTSRRTRRPRPSRRSGRRRRCRRSARPSDRAGCRRPRARPP